jgi:hypothetical protein
MKRLLVAFALVVVATASGCSIHHEVSFDEVETTWHYAIDGEPHDAGLVAVVDVDTLEQTVSIRSFMTGAANSWDARAGDMLRQVVDVELPQLFEHYTRTETYAEPEQGTKRMTLVLTIPSYRFEELGAHVTVHAVAYAPGRELLFENDYAGTGETQGAKMFWGGAFAMKSAVRQSSLYAFKQAMDELRADLIEVLDSPVAAYAPTAP